MRDIQQLSLAALIIAGDETSAATIAGQQLLEFQARRARAAGAKHVVLMVERIGSDLLGAVDRLRSEGLSVEVVRAAEDVAASLHPDEPVLVIDAGALLRQSRLNELGHSSGMALACLDFATDTRFELIDATTRWSGSARLDGALVREAAGGAGEWDLPSMLLRRAVQEGARRIMVPDTDVTRFGDQPPEALVLDPTTHDFGGGAGRRAFGPLTRQLASVVLGRGWGSEYPAIAALVLASLGLASGVAGHLTVCVLIALGADLALTAARIIGQTTLREGRLAAWYDRLRNGAWVSVALIIGVQLAERTGQWGCLVLAMVGIGSLALANVQERSRERLAWTADAPGLALIMLAGFVLGQPLLALTLAAFYAAATLAVPILRGVQA